MMTGFYDQDNMSYMMKVQILQAKQTHPSRWYFKGKGSDEAGTFTIEGPIVQESDKLTNTKFVKHYAAGHKIYCTGTVSGRKVIWAKWSFEQGGKQLGRVYLCATSDSFY